MKSQNNIDWLDGFGDSKSYRCYALRCSADIIFCARQLELLLHWNYSFMCDCPIHHEDPILNGQIFVSIFDDERRAFSYLLPNRFTIIDPDSSSTDLFSLETSLTDFYLFSKKGKHQFKSECSGYEYLLLFTADESYNLEQLEQALAQEPRLPVENLSHLLLHLSKPQKTSPATKFLRQLFVDLEIIQRDYDSQRIMRFLNGTQSISDNNYPYPLKPLFITEPTIAARYLMREDL